MEDTILRMKFLAGILNENQYIERSNTINLKKDINKIAKEITNKIREGIEGNKLSLNYKLEFESSLIPLKVVIKEPKKLENDYSITGSASPRTRSITLNIRINPLKISNNLLKLEKEIIITIWHELKHISQFHIRNQTKSGTAPSPRDIDYYLRKDEIEAHAEELKIKSELEGEDLEKIIQNFKHELNTWITNNIKASINVGYSKEDAIKYTGTPEDVEDIISQIKLYLNKNYNLTLK
jgi:hypothetical protein